MMRFGGSPGTCVKSDTRNYLSWSEWQRFTECSDHHILN